MSLRAIAILLCSLLLGACQTSGPATVEGECRIFQDPGFAVMGATPRDQRWVSRTQETGIRSCAWERPTTP